MAKHAKPSNESTDDVMIDQLSDVDTDLEAMDAEDVGAGVETDALADDFDDMDDEPVARGSHIQANIDERIQAEEEARRLEYEQDNQNLQQFTDEPDTVFAYPSEEPINQTQKVNPKDHPHLKKSRRVRIILLVVIVLLLCAFGGLVYLFVDSLTEVNAHLEDEAVRVSSSEQIEPSSKANTNEGSVNMGAIPELVGLVGLGQDEALALIGHGAIVTKSADIIEKTTEKDAEGNEIEKEEIKGVKITVSLKADPADKQGNTPSVYLKVNADGYVTQAGFSGSLDGLGVTDCSFADAVMAKNVVGDVLKATGVSAEKGILTLPEDKTLYKTMSADGKNVTEERYTFTSDVDINGSMTPWTCTLVYDYTAKNVSGNLNDTIKLIYVYIGE